jgi:hypothetical protein
MDIDIAHSRNSPPTTPSSPSTKLQLDLSDLPPLITPSPPSNTLLLTNLQNIEIFAPPTLQTIRDLLSQHAPLHSFSPLKSMRRIIVSFPTTEHAIELRKLLDGTELMGCPVRVYFGAPTPIEIRDQHLAAPESQKLFFISPPPSPPHGWMVRNEDPPNKAVHADDLASALAKLHSRADVAAADIMDEEIDRPSSRRSTGSGSGSATVVYHPDDHGARGDLPAVTVEDTSGEDTEGVVEKRIMTHTARPPVELMLDDMDCS